jgi:hypothetical protein
VSDRGKLRTYAVSARDREPLVEFIVDALHRCGCRVLHRPPANTAPFRFTFEAPDGERMGVIVYAFLANSRETKNRPADEHRFQLKYGSKDGQEHDLWQDPYRLYATLFVGINTELGFFVGADPVLHSPTKMFISIEFKAANAKEILARGWASWERGRRSVDDRPIEVLVGGRPESFLRYVRFEREARGEDQGHRGLLAEKLVQLPGRIVAPDETLVMPSPKRLHQLAVEFQMKEAEVFDLIEQTPRLKMAVRGWVAEEHLLRTLRSVPGVSECERSTQEGGADVSLRYAGARLWVECKNVLRKTTAAKLPRIDFQRTRASKSDPCSRYYGPADFDVVAACLHAVTERWEFRYVMSQQLDPITKCPGKLANNVVVDARWGSVAETVLAQAARRPTVV